MGDSSAPSSTTGPTRMFASMVAAETAYREQVALNQSLSTKFDELGSKIDALTSVMTQLVTKIDALSRSQSFSCHEEYYALSSE